MEEYRKRGGLVGGGRHTEEHLLVVNATGIGHKLSSGHLVHDTPHYSQASILDQGKTALSVKTPHETDTNG